MPSYQRWVFSVGLAVLLTVVPFAYYRYGYTHGKRLRAVTPGLVYRSGQLTAEGFKEAVDRYGIRTIVNLQDEFPDPLIARGFVDRTTVRETELCRQLGVRYVFIAPDLVSRRKAPVSRPEAIDQLLRLLDDPDAYPVLLHCHAGLHRTGVMVAVYRMEYDGWSWEQAYAEVKANGFGNRACTSANDYIAQYILNFRPGIRGTATPEPAKDTLEDE